MPATTPRRRSGRPSPLSGRADDSRPHPTRSSAGRRSPPTSPLRRGALAGSAGRSPHASHAASRPVHRESGERLLTKLLLLFLTHGRPHARVDGVRAFGGLV